VSATLPRLLDRKAIAQELGVKPRDGRADHAPLPEGDRGTARVRARRRRAGLLEEGGERVSEGASWLVTLLLGASMGSLVVGETSWSLGFLWGALAIQSPDVARGWWKRWRRRKDPT
jgi:hypothetical protein